MFFIVLEDTGYMAGIDSVELVISGSLVPDALRQNAAKPIPVMATNLREEVDEEDDLPHLVDDVEEEEFYRRSWERLETDRKEEEEEDEIIKPNLRRQSEKVIGVSVPRASPLVNQFDADYLVDTHPSVFPWGKGRQPVGMSRIAYYRLLAERVPISQFGHNIGLTFDMLDLWQRDQVRIVRTLKS